jgi:hypothetical protein
VSTASRLLPPGYEALEPFVERWAIAGAAQRAQRRSESSAAERLAFYDAAKDLAGQALDALDKKPISRLDDKETRLLDLIMSFAHVSLAVEVQGDAEHGHALLREHMRLSKVHSDAAS